MPFVFIRAGICYFRREEVTLGKFHTRMQIGTIAFLNWQYPGGGGETVSRNLGRFFLGQGYRVVIYALSRYDDILPDEDRRDFELRDVKRLPGKRIRIDPDALSRSLREEGVDLLVVQGVTIAPFEELRRQTACRIVFCLHSVPLWEVYAARSKRAADIPDPTWARKLEFLLLRRPLNRWTGKIRRRTLRLYAAMLPHLDRMVMLCPQYRDQMARLLRESGYPGGDAPAEKFLSIFNPLLPAAEPVRTPKAKVVLYAGRLNYEDKRVDRLLRIWRRIEAAEPDWKLRIVGRGREWDALHRLAQRLGLANVEFLGHRTDVAPFYREASFVCLTSDFEGWGLSLVEGQQYGAIPVSFDSSEAIRTITCDGEAGIPVPAFSERKYAERLLAAMRDEALQERLRENGYRAAENYVLEVVGREWLRLIEAL